VGHPRPMAFRVDHGVLSQHNKIQSKSQALPRQPVFKFSGPVEFSTTTAFIPTSHQNP
jgi:hypothetical protein